MLVKMFRMGEKNGHLQRILDSKLTKSEQSAPKYFMFKDHKVMEDIAQLYLDAALIHWGSVGYYQI